MKKKTTPGQIAIFCVLAVIAVLLVVLIVLMVQRAPGRAAKAPEETAPTTAEEVMQALTGQDAEKEPAVQLPEGVVLECGDYQVTNAEMNYCYWDTYFDMLSTYGDSVTQLFDPSVPLSEQTYGTSGVTWEGYLAEMAAESLAQMAVYSEAALAEGFTLPEEYAQEEAQLMEQYTQLVAEQGYESLDAYLKAAFGPDCTPESFQAYQDRYYLGMAYAEALYNQKQATPEEIAAYFEEHSQEYASYDIQQDDSPMIDLRHILLTPDDPDSEDSWAAAQAEAQAILDSWKTDPTEDNFAALAAAYSQDAGSAANGGLYEGVYSGAMDEVYTQWLFDESRQSGDVELLRSSHGWSLMYFVGQEEQAYWEYVAESDLLYEAYMAAAEKVYEKYPFQVDSDNVVLHTPEGMYE